MTATRILNGNNNHANNQNNRHRNYDNTFCSIPFQQFNNVAAVATANNNVQPVFDNSFPQALPLAEYQFVPNEIIVSPTSIYKVLQFMGKGTFGQVVKCWRLTYEDGSADANGRGASGGRPMPKLNRVEIVALKILKCHPSYERQAQTEAAVLGRLSREGIAGRFNVVQPHEFFRHKGHSCLVFEGLDINLYEYLKINQFKPVQLEHVRMIAHQVLIALAKLKSLGLIHADLKPENIMLVDSVQRPFRVKVIDFGSACFVSNVANNTYLQSRYYRAPEVILGLSYTEAIDMWSLGCVLAELFLGWPLYPGASEYDQIRYIVQTQGIPSDKLLKKANKTRQFFEQLPSGGYHGDQRCLPEGAVAGPSKQFRWSLKAPDAYERETGVKPKETRKYVMKSLKDLQMIGAVAPLEHNFVEINSCKADKCCFVNMLESILHMDGQSRMTPLEALNHPFVTLSHLREIGPSRLYTRSRILLDSCLPLTPQDMDELAGGQRLSAAPNVPRVVDNLTSTAPCVGMGAGHPGTAPFLQQGMYPVPPVFLDFPQHLHHQQPQVPMSYAFPPPVAPALPVHSSFHLGSLVFTSAPAAVVTQDNAYSLAAQNVSLIPSTQQPPNVDGQIARPQAVQVFDSLQGIGAAIQEVGRMFRPACAVSSQNPPQQQQQQPQQQQQQQQQQHLNNTHASVSNARFRRGRENQKSRKGKSSATSRNVVPKVTSSSNNPAPSQPGRYVLEWTIRQPDGSILHRQFPWNVRRNGGSNSRNQPETGSGAEGEQPRNNNNNSSSSNNNSSSSSNNNNNNNDSGNNNINSEGRSANSIGSCQASSLNRADRASVSQRVATSSSSGAQSAENKVCAGASDSQANRKERISQDSGLGRATLPTPNSGSVLASGPPGDVSSGNVSTGSDDKNPSPGFQEGGNRLLTDAMRNLQMPDDAGEAFLRDPPFERDDNPAQFEERSQNGEGWRDNERSERINTEVVYDDPLAYNTPSRRLLDYDPETLDALRSMSAAQRLPNPPSYAMSTSNEARAQMGHANGPGRRVHHHHPPDHARDNPAPAANRGPPNHQAPPATEYYPCRYQQRQNHYLLQQRPQPQLNQGFNQAPPTLLVYQPQQFQPYPSGPLYNVQPNRTMIPQHNHPTSIILLSPEGSPSVYSLSYGGNLVAAPANQAMNCGFYALGNPVVNQPNAQFNPQAVQYIYQA